MHGIFLNNASITRGDRVGVSCMLTRIYDGDGICLKAEEVERACRMSSEIIFFRLVRVSSRLIERRNMNVSQQQGRIHNRRAGLLEFSADCIP